MLTATELWGGSVAGALNYGDLKLTRLNCWQSAGGDTLTTTTFANSLHWIYEAPYRANIWHILHNLACYKEGIKIKYRGSDVWMVPEWLSTLPYLVSWSFCEQVYSSILPLKKPLSSSPRIFVALAAAASSKRRFDPTSFLLIPMRMELHNQWLTFS